MFNQTHGVCGNKTTAQKFPWLLRLDFFIARAHNIHTRTQREQYLIYGPVMRTERK
jgi:hypothetical protein